MVALNNYVGSSTGSAQEQWLKADLAATNKSCIAAYWHEPRFTSGSEHGNNTAAGPLWDDLYAAHADLVLNGHDHQYERFALQNPSGAADSNGIREFVVGTGGASVYPFGTIQPNSQIRDATSHGVLKLTLHAGSYDWDFRPSDGTFTDSGTTACH
jgi:acid phosphatase type 7